MSRSFVFVRQCEFKLKKKQKKKEMGTVGLWKLSPFVVFIWVDQLRFFFESGKRVQMNQLEDTAVINFLSIFLSYASHHSHCPYVLDLEPLCLSSAGTTLGCHSLDLFLRRGQRRPFSS